MIINAVGCPNSGTDMLAYILSRAGTRTRSDGPDLLYDRRIIDRRIPYDFKETPDWIKMWIDRFENNGYNDYMHIDKSFFHNSWGRFCAMYALEQKYPNVRFLIMLRNPKNVIGDWFRKEGTTGLEVTIETYKNTVLKIYEFMLAQIDFLNNEPLVMDYDIFLGNGYNKWIFDTFDIEHSLENYHNIQNFLKLPQTRFKPYSGDIDKILVCQNKLKNWMIK